MSKCKNNGKCIHKGTWKKLLKENKTRKVNIKKTTKKTQVRRKTTSVKPGIKKKPTKVPALKRGKKNSAMKMSTLKMCNEKNLKQPSQMDRYITPKNLLAALKLNPAEKKFYMTLDKRAIENLTEIYNIPQNSYNERLTEINRLICNLYAEKRAYKERFQKWVEKWGLRDHEIPIHAEAQVPYSFVEMAHECDTLFETTERYIYSAALKGKLWSDDAIYMLCLNKLRNKGVYVPQNDCFIIRQVLHEDGYTTYADAAAVSECKKVNDSVVNIFNDCTDPTTKKIMSIIQNTNSKYNRILIPITLYKTIDGCRHAGLDHHANALLVDMKERTLGVFDPNPMNPIVQKFYATFFSKVAKDMKVPKNTKPYEYVEIPLTCQIAHRGLCAYAVIPAALGMHLSIPEFMQFVLDIMTCRHNRLTKKSTLKLLDDYRRRQMVRKELKKQALKL